MESINPSPEVLKLIPETLIRKHEIIPLGMNGKNLILGMTDPNNVEASDAALFASRCKGIERRLITETTFRRFLSTRYATAMLMNQLGEESFKSPIKETDQDRKIRAEAPDAALPPVVRLANYILEQAIVQRASDIHIEPYETFFRVRFRVDGCLYTVLTPTPKLQNPLVSRIKILAEMDISERRKPQDGHMSMFIGLDHIQFRVSTLPTSFGEKCVIRLMKKEAHLADIGRLGFSAAQLADIKRVAKMPQGLALVTGPTGSGKTTSVHAMLNYINDPDVNIV